MHKLQELSRLLDLGLDLHELATNPTDSDLDFVHKMRDAEEKTQNL